MDRPGAKLVLWVGPKHSGKSTAAQRLIDRAMADGLSVAGILAPTIYQRRRLAGFDIVDVATGDRRPLARRADGEAADVGRFVFSPEGLRLGHAALRAARAASASLAIVDEFGPLKLRGKGWRGCVDRLVSQYHGTLLIVVREELAAVVEQIYAPWRPRRVPAVAGHIDPLPWACE